MKIAILTQPRTSSTNLTFLIGRSLSCKIYNEPFHGFFNKQDALPNKNLIEGGDNLVMKEMLFTHFVDDIKDHSDFIKWSLDHFDKIIFLLRRDVKLQAESYLYNLLISMQDKSKLMEWHKPKMYEVEIIPKFKLDSEIKRITERNNMLLEESIKNNIPLFYYEDLILNEGINDSVRELMSYVGAPFNHKLIKRYYGSDRKVRLHPKETKTLI